MTCKDYYGYTKVAQSHTMSRSEMVFELIKNELLDYRFPESKEDIDELINDAIKAVDHLMAKVEG